MKPTTNQIVFAKVICELIDDLSKCLIVRQGKDMFRLPKSKVSKWGPATNTLIFVFIDESYCREFGIYETA